MGKAQTKKPTRRTVKTATLAQKKRTVSLKPSSNGTLCPIVGIGASAGGYEAVSEFLKNIAPNTGLAFVVVQHLDPSHRSALPELLGRVSRLPVIEIPPRICVEPNRVYVMPSNKCVTIEDCVLKLSERTAVVSSAIDLFFESLARDHAGRAIGIVMSGAGSDGSIGLRAIKDAGGLTFVQSEASAKFAAMPRSALQTGCVDAALSPRALAKEIGRIARHPHVYDHPVERDEPLPDETNATKPDGQLGGLFAILKQHSGVDFSRYKQNTLRRRLERRMVLRGTKSLDAYLKFLHQSPNEIDKLFSDLLINVTRFFRDKSAFQALKRRVLPALVKRKGGKGDLRVWVPGCASGEEAYSMAMCILEALPPKSRTRVQIFGTDLSENAITRARTGLYSTNIAKDVSADRLKRFFCKIDNSYQVNRSVRDLCTFARHNLTTDAPFSRLDLITCRNLLIYLGPDLQKKCLPVFHYALNPGGYLMLGPSESVGASTDLFDLIDKRNKIYVRKTTSVRPQMDFARRLQPLAELLPLNSPARSQRGGNDIATQLQLTADRITLRQFAPSGVVIDSNLDVVQFRGNTGPYLEHAPGAASLNILHLARPSLVADLRLTIHRALKRNQPARKQNATLKYDSQTRRVNIDAIPLKLPEITDKWLLVLFEQAEVQPEREARKPSVGKKNGDTRELRRVRGELDSTKQSLQTIIEEQEATNEELKSANEEIESANEELQSTNEELETAKEELQSTNEELTTLNEELSTRNLEMIQTNNDLNNLLSSINLPIVMVGNDLSIRRATPGAREPFNIIPSDIGRRLIDLKPNIDIPELDQLLREVLETLKPREREVHDQEGRWYTLRIQPYRTFENNIDGAVITLIDISSAKKSIAQLEATSAYTEAIVETVREPMLVLDSALRVQKANRAFYKVFRVDPRATEQKMIYKLGKGEWDIPELRHLLGRILPNRSHFENFELKREFSEIGKRTMLLNARQLENEGEKLILVAMEDVTEGRGFSQTR